MLAGRDGEAERKKGRIRPSQAVLSMRRLLETASNKEKHLYLRNGFEVCFAAEESRLRMRVDLYTKVVLTVIAIALMGIFAQSVLRPGTASAQPGTDYSRLEVSATGS